MTARYQNLAKQTLAWAVLALPGLGQEPVDGIAKLIDQLNHDQTRGRATESLVSLGEPVVPFLTGFLAGARQREPAQQKRHLAQKKAVLAVLARLGREGAGCLDFLATWGLDCELELLPPLARTIADLAPYGEVPASVLAADLTVMKERSSSRDGWERSMIQLTPDILRERMAVDPDASTEHLIWILKSNRTYQREVAAEELGRRRVTAAISPLSKALSAGGSSPAGAGMTFLVGTRNQGGDDFQARAARALLAIDPQAPLGLVAYAYQLINCEEAGTRLRAAMAMGRFGPQAAPAVNDLLLALWDEDIEVRREVVTALGMIGPDAKDAVPTLENLVEHEDRQIAERAKAALRRIRK